MDTDGWQYHLYMDTDQNPSTGFNGGGATVEDVALMRRVVGPDMGVKAAGGVRSFEDAVQMIKAGATRLGASSGVAIVTGQTSSGQY